MSGAIGYVGDPFNSTWRINVSGQVYGPYTGHQLKAFAAEGRIAPHSIVQVGEHGHWITAIDDPVLSQLFIQHQPQVKPAPQVVQTQLHTHTHTPAQPQAAVQPAHGAHQQPAVAEAASANFIVIADIRARSSTPFEAAMNKLGQNYRLNQLTWVLHTDKTAGQLRNELVQHIGQSDNIFIVDATRGKMAWFNLGPEADARIRKVWQKSADNRGV